MRSLEIPGSDKIQVPDPCKFLSVLYEIWFREHGANVTCKFIPNDERKTED